MKNKTFAENLKRERKNKGFTQETISVQLEIPQKTYAKWEEGRAEPGLNYLKRLNEILQIDDLYLFISKSLVNN